MSLRLSCFLILAMSLPVYTSAQSVPSEGDRVRIRRASGAPVTGVVSSVSPSAIRLLADGDTELVISLDEVERIEKSLGRHRRFTRNFLVTVSASAAVMGVVEAVSWSRCTPVAFGDCWFHPSSRMAAFGSGAAAGGLIGLPLGVIIGLGVKNERWERLPHPRQDRYAFSIQPVLGWGFGFSASFALGGR